MKLDNKYAVISILQNPESELYHWKHIKEESQQGYLTEERAVNAFKKDTGLIPLMYQKDYDSFHAIAMYMSAHPGKIPHPGSKEAVYKSHGGEECMFADNDKFVLGKAALDRLYEPCNSLVQESIAAGHRPGSINLIDDVRKHMDQFFRCNEYCIEKPVTQDQRNAAEHKKLLGDLYDPSYDNKIKLKGYSKEGVTVCQCNDSHDMAKILIKSNPKWSKKDHLELAKSHEAARSSNELKWDKTVNEASLAAFGKPYHITDYKVSGIARDEFSEDHKKTLRLHSHAAGLHSQLAKAHEIAAKNLHRYKTSERTI
jgi:hypothetical protein